MVIDQSTSFVVKFVNDGIYWEDPVVLAFADTANFAEKIRSQLHVFEELTVILDFELDKEEQYELNEP